MEPLITADGVEVTPEMPVWRFFYSSCRVESYPAGKYVGIVSARYSTREACIKATLEDLNVDIEDIRQQLAEKEEYRDQVAALLSEEI